MKGLRLLGILACLLIALTLFFLLFTKFAVKQNEAEPAAQKLLADHGIDDIEAIYIKNKFNEYTVRRENGNFVIGDLPSAQVNGEYLYMLLDESSRVEYGEIVSVDGGDYGFDDPQSELTVRYLNGETISLVIGNQEPLSRGCYCKEKDTVYLLDNSRTVRFIMPLTRFIHYEIVPFTGFQSPLRAVKKLRLGGGKFSKPVLIEEVRSDEEEAMRDAASFGVATHLIRSPVLHEIDQTECIAVFGSLSGLLNREVYAYNCGDEELAALGFNDPLVTVEYDYQQNEKSAVEHILLKVVRHGSEYLLVRDGQRVVHAIESKPFIETTYEKLVMRWFLTPFVTDLQSMDLLLDGKQYRFEFSGETNRELTVTMNGKEVPIEQFRKFYTLLISAANDGVLLQNTPPSALLMELKFHYKDTLKNADTMSIYEGGSRRLNVAVNGITEFAMLVRYISVVRSALASLEKGADFNVNW